MRITNCKMYILKHAMHNVNMWSRGNVLVDTCSRFIFSEYLKCATHARKAEKKLLVSRKYRQKDSMFCSNSKRCLNELQWMSFSEQSKNVKHTCAKMLKAVVCTSFKDWNWKLYRVIRRIDIRETLYCSLREFIAYLTYEWFFLYVLLVCTYDRDTHSHESFAFFHNHTKAQYKPIVGDRRYIRKNRWPRTTNVPLHFDWTMVCSLVI